MKKILFLFGFLPLFLAAQKENIHKPGFSLGFGLKNHFPLHYFKSTYSYGFGAELSIEYKFSRQLGAILNPGYLTYFYNQKNTGVSGSTGYGLLLGGLKYYPFNNIYLAAEAGLGIKTSQFGKESALAKAFGAGYYFAPNFNVEMKYLKGSGTTFTPEVLGITLTYIFLRNKQSHVKAEGENNKTTK